MALFYLGTHAPDWLARPDFRHVPLFVSHRRLVRRKTYPVAVTRWALDSGGFSEITGYGAYRTTPKEYATAARRYQTQIGGMDWASIQDWMCEPFALAKTGLTMIEHQLRTIRSLSELRQLAPDVRWAPVLQGWLHLDYVRHVNMYLAAGIDLASEPVVGVGSICRRQATSEAEYILRTLSNSGLHVHGFGLKKDGLRHVGRVLKSADSMAWSYRARHSPPMPGHAHKHCGNCPEYALAWRSKLLAALRES